MDVGQFIEYFNHRFGVTERTLLVGGADEPLYVPASQADDNYSRIYFREDFFASALHELSHWCIAGPERRLKTDFGYWYEPEGRTAAQQQQFEKVEIKPQALEWILSKVLGRKFRVSADNLDGEVSPTESLFKQNIHAQVQAYLINGLPRNAVDIVDMCIENGIGKMPSPCEFCVTEIE